MSKEDGPLARQLELWLDCRSCLPEVAAPLSCDRRLLASSYSMTLGSRDLKSEEDRVFHDCSGRLEGFLCNGSAEQSHHKAMAAVGSATWVVLDGEVCRPSEQLLTACKRHSSRLGISLRSLEHLKDLNPDLRSVGALLIDASSTDLWDKAVLARLALNSTGSPLQETVAGGRLLPATEKMHGARVESVQFIAGPADRVCVDLIQNLAEGEGALIGASADALCFTHAETAASESSPARPFRISAGPVHECVALPDGRTKYLSNISAGDEMLVLRADGTGSRSVTVGRAHVERVHVVCLHLKLNSKTTQLFFERSPAVRLQVKRCSADSSVSTFTATAVPDIAEGDEVLVHWVGD